MKRNTTIRDRHRALIAQGRPPCSICGGEIDYTIPYRRPDGTVNPDSYVVDHITALNRGGPDSIDNKQAAHARCNSIKSDTAPAPQPEIQWATHRHW